MQYTITPIAFVRNNRKDVEDDYWGNVISIIELVDEIDDSALQGISEFSHLDIIFYFDRVTDDTIHYGARHPRNRKEYPKVGIFAQRGKHRPNKLGLTTVELLEHQGRTLKVRGLDAIDGTPIIDIKPVMKDPLPKGEVRQPAWSVSLMERYWDSCD